MIAAVAARVAIAGDGVRAVSVRWSGRGRTASVTIGGVHRGRWPVVREDVPGAIRVCGCVALDCMGSRVVLLSTNTSGGME